MQGSQIFKNEAYNGANDRKSLLDLVIPENYNDEIILFIHGYMGFKDWGCWNLVSEYFALPLSNQLKEGPSMFLLGPVTTSPFMGLLAMINSVFRLTFRLERSFLRLNEAEVISRGWREMVRESDCVS